MAAVTERQIRMLAEFLEGDHPTHTNNDGTREWNLKCPIHGDERRSASLNIDKGVFYCFKCGGMPVTKLIRMQEDWTSVSQNGHRRPDLSSDAPDKKTRVLSEGMIAGWHSGLMSNEAALQWLRERRGITAKTVASYEIGWDPAEKSYTIPVRSTDGEIWNVRYYNPTPREGRRKIWSEKGYGSPPRLYPVSALVNVEEVIIAAGEWDTLLALQFGYAAITRTAGENQWDNSWGELFAGKTVYICQDADAEGQGGNVKIARALQQIADVRIVELPYAVVEKHGKDLSDFLLDHEPSELRSLLNKAKPFGKSKAPRVEKDVETVTVLDTFDSHRVGEAMRVIVTIKGKKEPGYTVPHLVHLVCSQDAGAKCQICPMKAATGDARVRIAHDDPLILHMVEHSTRDVSTAIADAFGVPGGRCVKLQQEVEEHQAVEVLFGRPALDYSDGTKAGEYKNIKITSVGRHDTAPNNTVSVVGALQPNPKSQGNEFLAHSLEVMETSVDRFELNGKTIALMQRFQSEGKPLRKLAEINMNLAEHVTRIHGRPEMHALMDIVFHSPLSFDFAGERVARGWLEALIVGDTRTGKSLAATRFVQHYSAGEVISCEAASFAGVVGGLQTLGSKDWAVTWGIIPINDRRLVVLDEVSGLTQEEIAQMSDIRSSGQAKLIKIQQETTWARARLLWLANPRNATMANYTYGVDAIKPLIGNAEDIARFDLAMAVTMFDVPAETINQPAGGGELIFTSEACHSLLMWVWTRQAEQVVWAERAEGKVFDAANELGKMYIEDPPLIQAANIRIKIARVSAAIAARLFSTDSSYENIVVQPQHVDAAVQFINLLYGMDSFGYRERSREQLGDRLVAENNKDSMAQYLKGRPTLAKYLRTTGKFRRQDLDEIMNLSREESNAIISTLYENRMVRKVLGDIVVEPTLHTLLRETRW